MDKEELLNELEYLNNVIASMDEHNGDLSFICWQRSQVEEELAELEKKENESKAN